MVLSVTNLGDCGEAVPDNEGLSILCHFPGGREGQALHIGAQAADVLSQRLGQHVDMPLHQVIRDGPAAVKAETISGQKKNKKRKTLALSSGTMGASVPHGPRSNSEVWLGDGDGAYEYTMLLV